MDRHRIISTARTSSSLSSLGLGGGTLSTATLGISDVHAVSHAEAISYYAGLHSKPRLLYRTGKKWPPSSGSEPQRRPKQLCEVFNHPIVDIWNDNLGWKVVGVLDKQKVN